MVKSLSVSVTETGPVFVDVVYEIEWLEGGFYRATFRVIDSVPLVKITEEFDLNKLDGNDFWQLQLAKGWAPDMMETARTLANGGVDSGSTKPLANLKTMNNLRISPDNLPMGVNAE